MTKEEWTAEAKRRAEEWSWNNHPGSSEIAIVAYNAILAGIAIGATMMRERAAEVCEHYVDYEGHNQGHFIAPLIRALEIPKEER